MEREEVLAGRYSGSLIGVSGRFGGIPSGFSANALRLRDQCVSAFHAAAPIKG